MRITNGMMINNTLTNINKNKSKMDELYTQITSEKKIQRPSDDPIVAIRALRFRSTLSEIEQYTTRNIPDAESWLKITDDALGNVVGLLGDIKTYCNQAVNGYYDTDSKTSIVQTLEAYRSQIYAGANLDCAGRSIFTGYKTDKTLSFTEDMPEQTFEITQKIKTEDFDKIRKMNNSVDIDGLTVSSAATFDVDSVEAPGYTDVFRMRLAYDGISDAGDHSLTTYKLNDDGTAYDTRSYAVTRVSVDSPAAYDVGPTEIHFIPETGEYIFGKDVYSEISLQDEVSVTYTKTGFEKNELNPIHYFDCKDVNTSTYYTAKDQPIKYEINFNQDIQINVEGKDVYTHDMGRDIDDIINSVNTVGDIESKIESIKFMMESTYEGSTAYSNLNKLLQNCERELDFAKDEMENRFAAALTKFTEHFDQVNKARSDVGAREIRLELVSERLATQETTVKDLKSVNEEADVTALAVQYKEASSIYDASLAAAGKVVQNKLIDFI